MATPEGLPGAGVGVGDGVGVGVGVGLGVGVGDGVGVGVGVVPPGTEAAKWSIFQPSPSSHDSIPALPAGSGDESV